MQNLDVAVWGSTGYAGQELVSILKGHPNVSNITLVGRDMPGNLEDIKIAFLALQHGVSGGVARQLSQAGSSVIDLSGDFRFKTAEEYEAWYDQEHPAPELLPVPYALPELSRATLRGSKLIAMPGCYPTATLLGVMPLIKAELIRPDTPLVIDAISGVSGMGKAKKAQANEIVKSKNVVPYSVGRVHRHVGEIEQHLGGREIFFSPSVGPFFRGMIVKTTALLNEGIDPSTVNATLQEAYASEPFVKVLPDGKTPRVKDTKHSDLCHVGSVVKGKTVQVISSLDNLRKGAASQAVQAFNSMHGLPEGSGLLRAA